MRDFNFFLFLLLILASCKSSEKLNAEFKQDIQAYYPENQICFRVDKSMNVGNFGQLLFKRDSLERENKWKLTQSFSSGDNCTLVALVDRLNDSIIVGAVYPYKADIEQSLSEYTRWFYDGKVYVKTANGKDTKMDTISVQHNPPINNPWIKPEKMD